MANYKEQTGTGTTWKRANQVIIKNNLNATKNILFFEEDVIQLADKIVQADAGFLSSTYDSAAIINLRDPNTGERTGNTVPQALVYQALYSLYIDLAELRDLNPEIDLGSLVNNTNT